jgi:hypothetical protein
MTPLFMITPVREIRLRTHGEPAGQEDGYPSD